MPREAVYVWLLDGEPCGDGPAYRFVGEEEGSRYLDLRVTTPGGTAAEQLRIDVEALTPPYTLPCRAPPRIRRRGGHRTAPRSRGAGDAARDLRLRSVDGTEVAATREYTLRAHRAGHYPTRCASPQRREDGTEHVEFAVRAYAARRSCPSAGNSTARSSV